jgi:succinoglycan biosynthesis transport protein ExoP
MNQAMQISQRRDLSAGGRLDATSIEAAEQRFGIISQDGLIPRIKALLAGRWHWAIASGLLLGAVAGFAGWKLGQKTYASHGEIYVAPFVDDYGLGDPTDRAVLFQNYDALIDTQIQYLKSMRVIDKAMASDAWRSLGRGYSNKNVAEFIKNIEISHKGEIIFVEMRDFDPDGAMVGARSLVEAYQSLTAEEDAERGKGKLEFLQSEAARVTSNLVDIDAAIKTKMQEQGYGDFSADDLTTLFAAKLNDATLANRRLDDVHRELAMQDNARQEFASTRPASLEGISNGGLTTTRPAAALSLLDVGQSAAEIAIQNSQMAALLSKQHDLEDRRQMLVSKYRPDHQLVKNVELDLIRVAEDIKDFRDSFLAWQIRLQTGLNDPLERQKLKRLETTLQASAAETDSALDKITRLKRDIQELRERADLERRSRDDIKRRLESQERVSRLPGRVRVLEAADKPLGADSDTRPRLAAAGGVGGLVTGFGLIALIGLLDQRVRSSDDARRIGLLGRRPVLGLLPALPDDVEDFEQAARCVHQVRTLLQLWYGGMNRPAFAIAGPASGSGKTTLTLALGLSYAKAHSRTLLIDFDFIGGGLTRRVNAITRRRIGRILLDQGLLKDEQLQEAIRAAADSNTRLGEALVKLGHLSEAEVTAALARQQENTLGVVNVLEGESLSECVFPTDVKNLSILPLGDAGAHHVGSISPLGIQQLIDAARADYDVVLIDTGPLPGSLEGAAAVAAADGVVLTVSRGDSRSGLRQCERYLDSIGARLAGVVFNRATPRDFAAARGTATSSSQPFEVGRRSNGIPNELSGRRFGPFGDAVAHASKRDKNASVR